MNVPNQLNHARMGSLRGFCLFLCLQSKFDKNADFGSVGTGTSLSAELVWRLPEFAFFVRLLRWSHFLFVHLREETMDHYDLALNEGIILRHEGAYHNQKFVPANSSGKSSELLLTNLNLIFIESKIKMFKPVYTVLKFPLNQIKIVDGQVQAFILKKPRDWTLQVLMQNGAETFQFPCEFYERIKVKQEVGRWIEQMSLLLTGKSAENGTDASLVGEIKNVLGTVGINVKSKKPENVTAKCIGCMAPISGEKGQTVRCKYCDTEQTL